MTDPGPGGQLLPLLGAGLLPAQIAREAHQGGQDPALGLDAESVVPPAMVEGEDWSYRKTVKATHTGEVNRH